MSAFPVLRLLAALEIDACDCPFEWGVNEVVEFEGAPPTKHYHLIPCPHVLGLTPHEMEAGKWGEMLALTHPWDPRDPDCYGEPPPALSPKRCLRREARVAMMAQRYERGVSLYDPGDYLPRTNEDAILETVAHRERNGASYDGELVATGGAA